MREQLDGTEYTYCNNGDEDPTLTHFTFFRDPIKQFLSGYSEVVFRIMNEDNEVSDIPSEYRTFLKILDKHVNHAARAKEGSKTSMLERYKRLTKTEEGTLVFVEAFERFVNDYDGKNKFDPHIVPQIEGKISQIIGKLPLHKALRMEDGVLNQIEMMMESTNEDAENLNAGISHVRFNQGGNTTTLID
ncbi:MAG: hypothetical protein SGARI_004984, partial [Bacillariaceae sp.]